MKGKKKLLIIIPAVFMCIVIAITSVGIVGFLNEREKQVSEWNNTRWFSFAKVLGYSEGSINVSYDEIKAYIPQKDIYNSKVYYNTLTEDEKVLYNALEYAFDHNYVYIFVEESVMSKTEKTMENIIDFVSLDSPVLQQNVDWEWYDHEITFSQVILFKTEQRLAKGDLVAVRNFSKERTDKVQQAVDTASKWDLGFSEDATDEEKARAIYRYIDENIEYESGEVDRKKDYLCTAVSGKTNCDGFSNIYSLLCNMNGLECFEKYSVPAEEDGDGHTWSTVLISDKWYNVDCTPSEGLSANDIERERMRFGYSDEYCLQTPEFVGVFPESTECITPYAGHFESCSADNVLSDICDAYRASDDGFVIVAFDVFDEEECDLFQDVANRLYKDIDIVTLLGDEMTICHVAA